MPRSRRMTGVGLALALVAFVSGLYLWFVPANPTTVSLSYLLSIMLVATWWGIVPAMIASTAAMLSFNMLFLPPVGTLTITDPQNWVSFVAFMATAVVVSQLSGRARERQLEAQRRQQDLERLYALSRALLLADRDAPLPAQLARRVAEVFQVSTVALFDPRSAGTIAWGGPGDRPDIEAKLRDVARTGEVIRGHDDLVVAPLRLGGAPIGSLAVAGGLLGDAVLQSIANLVAIGLERARGQEAMAASEAARQSGELRAALLDAVAHEFKTPLTAGKAAASALLSTTRGDDDRELVVIVNEELDRMQALVSDAIRMLRIDAGDVVVHRGRHLVSDLIAQAVADMGGRLGGHALTAGAPAGLTVDADASLIRLALRQLLDNAVKYSPPDSAIGVAAVGDGGVEITVANTGPAISPIDRARLFDRFYRGAQSARIPGSGLGLAIVQRIAEAHGGRAEVASDGTTGTTFTLRLPAAVAGAGTGASRVPTGAR